MAGGSHSEADAFREAASRDVRARLRSDQGFDSPRSETHRIYDELRTRNGTSRSDEIRRAAIAATDARTDGLIERLNCVHKKKLIDEALRSEKNGDRVVTTVATFSEHSEAFARLHDHVGRFESDPADEVFSLIRNWSQAWRWREAFKNVTDMRDYRDWAAKWSESARKSEHHEHDSRFAELEKSNAETLRAVMLAESNELEGIEGWVRANTPAELDNLPVFNLLADDLCDERFESLAKGMKSLEGRLRVVASRDKATAEIQYDGDDSSESLEAAEMQKSYPFTAWRLWKTRGVTL